MTSSLKSAEVVALTIVWDFKEVSGAVIGGWFIRLVVGSAMFSRPGQVPDAAAGGNSWQERLLHVST